MLTEAELRREAARSGFRPEVLEKVLHLLELLDALRSHPFLAPRLALKGGTALNLFLFDAPRLSVDIDVNVAHGAHVLSSAGGLRGVERSGARPTRAGRRQARRALWENREPGPVRRPGSAGPRRRCTPMAKTTARRGSRAASGG